MGRPRRMDNEETIVLLQPASTICPRCGNTARVAYHTQRRVTTLQGHFHLALTVRRCQQESCPRYHRPYRPEEEGDGHFRMENMAWMSLHSLGFCDTSGIKACQKSIAACMSEGC
jgi:hypothetical protein